MKILIVHPNPFDCALFLDWLKSQTRHPVLGWSRPNPVEGITRHEPDVVFGEVTATYHALFPETLFLPLPDSIDFGDAARQKTREMLTHAENVYRALLPEYQGSDAGRYVVYQDSAFRESAKENYSHLLLKFGQPEHRPLEKTKFIQQLQTGAAEGRYLRARRYLAILHRFDRRFQLETACQLRRGPDRISELRDHLARWFTVFAHYLNGFELDHCPGPQPISPRTKFIHHRMPLNYRYAIEGVLMLGINRALHAEVVKAISWSVGKQSSDALAGVGFALMGIGKYLARAAIVQVRVMELFLNSDATFSQSLKNLKSAQRDLEIYFECWGWDYRPEFGPELRRIVRDFHEGRTQVGNPPLVPPWREFRSHFSEE